MGLRLSAPLNALERRRVENGNEPLRRREETVCCHYAASRLCLSRFQGSCSHLCDSLFVIHASLRGRSSSLMPAQLLPVQAHCGVALFEGDREGFRVATHEFC